MTPDGSRVGRRIGTLLQVAAGTLLLGLLLVLAEGAARLVVGPPPAGPKRVGGGGDDYVSDTLAGLDIAPELNPTPLVTDPFVLWWNKPGARKTQPVNPRPFGRTDTWTIANDAHGFRGQEHALGDAESVYRILCVGDSVTFGFNVDQPSVYPSRLEEILRSRHPGKRIDVFNAGVPGWSWVQGLRFFEAYGLDLHPDLVIAAHGTNDQFWPAQVTDRERLPGAGRPAPEMPPVSFLARTSVYRFVQQMRRPAGPAGPSPVCQSELARIGTCRRVPLSDIETTIRELADRVRASGADFVALNADFMETAAGGAARKAVETGRLTFVDFVERLHARQDALDRERAAALGLAAPGPAGARVFGGPKRIVLRVRGDFAAGASVSARGAAPFRDDFPFTIALHDDGQAGDEIAGDRVFSGVLEAPAQIGAIEYTFWLDGACEFEPLPPVLSSTGTRLLRFDRDTMGPIAEFGDGGLMAERTHPNARGQAIIAEELAALIEGLPSFQRWLAGRRSSRPGREP